VGGGGGGMTLLNCNLRMGQPYQVPTSQLYSSTSCNVGRVRRQVANVAPLIRGRRPLGDKSTEREGKQE